MAQLLHSDLVATALLCLSLAMFTVSGVLFATVVKSVLQRRRIRQRMDER